MYHRLSVFALAFLLLLPLLWGCVTAPPDTFQVTATQLQRRQTETRMYEGISEADLLTASTNVLQDLGFNLENSETALGVITANKQRDATDGGELAVSLIFGVLGGVDVPVSVDQNIRVTLVVRPVLDSKGKDLKEKFYVRVNFQRLVRRSDGSILAETVREPALYQEFHDKLSKSVFIEAQKI